MERESTGRPLVEFVGRFESIPVVVAHGLLVGWIGDADDFDGRTGPRFRDVDVCTVASEFGFGFVDFVSFDLVPIHWMYLHGRYY